MTTNRTMGTASVVPELVYPDVGAAVDWLCEVFGFSELWRAGNHRARVAYGNGILVVADASSGRQAPGPGGGDRAHSVMVQVDDVDAHYQRAVRHGARVSGEPEDHMYGERQYSAEDLAGHVWTFSQSIADVAPEEWGATTPSTPTDR